MRVAHQGRHDLLCVSSFRSWILGASILAAALTPTFAADAITLHESRGEYPVSGSHLEYLEDPDSNLTIDDVRGPGLSEQFTEAETEVLNFGFTDSAYWLRFRLNSTAADTTEWLVEFAYLLLDSLDFYSPTPSGAYVLSRTGDLLPFHERDVEHRNFVFSVRLRAGESATFYARSQTLGSTELPVRVWSPTAFAEKSSRESYFFAFSYGPLNKFLGDGIMVLFGAADDLAERKQAHGAVSMAVAMQKRLRTLALKWREEGVDHEIQARMGIHQDYVTLGNLGSTELMDFTAIGGGVNLASRLENACPPGRITVSFPVYSLTKSDFRYAPLQELTFKGFQRSLKVCELDPETANEPAPAREARTSNRITRLEPGAARARRRGGSPGQP